MTVYNPGFAYPPVANYGASDPGEYINADSGTKLALGSRTGSPSLVRATGPGRFRTSPDGDTDRLSGRYVSPARGRHWRLVSQGLLPPGRKRTGRFPMLKRP